MIDVNRKEFSQRRIPHSPVSDPKFEEISHLSDAQNCFSGNLVIVEELQN